MTHQHILEKAIQKAIDGGWKGLLIHDGHYYDHDFINWRYDEETRRLINDEPSPEDYEELPVEAIIFNHDFAKSLWSNSFGYITYRLYDSALPPTGDFFINGWKFHFQQMVIADDPILYLEGAIQEPVHGRHG
jgi:hypothetical protein